MMIVRRIFGRIVPGVVLALFGIAFAFIASSDSAHAVNTAAPPLLFPAATLPATADSIPAFLKGVRTQHGTQDIVFVTTKPGDIVALNAHTGVQIWSKSNPAGSCHINNGGSICYTTSAPAIDPNHRYVYSYGLDGKIHKYAVGDGTEITTGGWPEVATIKPNQEKGSSWLIALKVRSGKRYLYMANGGYPGDNGDYQGHITTINLATGQQHVFNAVCSDQADVHFADSAAPDCPTVQTAIWARIPVAYDKATNRIYTATGNGDFTPALHYWGDTVFALKPDGTGINGNPLDTYTPTNFQALQNNDTDIGSTAPVVLPVSSHSKVRHLGVQSGKDSQLRLINLDNLSGQGKTGQTGGEVGPIIGLQEGGDVLTAPLAWVDPHTHITWLFVASYGGIEGLKLVIDSKGAPSLQSVWHNPGGGTTPVISNGVLYFVKSHSVQALDPHTGVQIWQDTQIGSIHWESPLVANNTLYITDNNSKLYAYDLSKH